MTGATQDKESDDKSSHSKCALEIQTMKSFSELTGKEKSVELLRWLLVPIVAAIVPVVPNVIGALVMPRLAAPLPGTSPTPDLPRIVLPWIFLGLTGAAFVIAGAKTAPRSRLTTAIVLAALWSLSALLSHVLMQPSPGIRNYEHFTVTALSAVGGAAYLFRSEKSKGQQPGQPTQDSSG